MSFTVPVQFEAPPNATSLVFSLSAAFSASGRSDSSPQVSSASGQSRWRSGFSSLAMGVK